MEGHHFTTGFYVQFPDGWRKLVLKNDGETPTWTKVDQPTGFATGQSDISILPPLPPPQVATDGD